MSAARAQRLCSLGLSRSISNNCPQLLNAEDSHTDGISREINRVLVAEHSKTTHHKNTLEGFDEARRTSRLVDVSGQLDM